MIKKSQNLINFGFTFLRYNENMEPRLSTKLSRRDFLKLTTQFVGLALAKKIIPPVIIDSGLDMSLSITADGMGSPIPQEFASIPIPEKNNDYRAPENIIIDALDLYEV